MEWYWFLVLICGLVNKLHFAFSISQFCFWIGYHRKIHIFHRQARWKLNIEKTQQQSMAGGGGLVFMPHPVQLPTYHTQWLCNVTQGNVVPPPVIDGSKRSPTSDCYNANKKHMTTSRGPKPKRTVPPPQILHFNHWSHGLFGLTLFKQVHPSRQTFSCWLQAFLSNAKSYNCTHKIHITGIN